MGMINRVKNSCHPVCSSCKIWLLCFIHMDVGRVTLGPDPCMVWGRD